MSNTKTIAQQLNIKKFPFRIKDDNGKLIYHEYSGGGWYRYERDDEGNKTYSEYSNGGWCRYEYDDDGNETYSENSDGNWYRNEYDDEGNKTYHENSYGFKTGTKRSSTKELTLEDVAKLAGIPVKNLKIIK